MTKSDGVKIVISINDHWIPLFKYCSMLDNNMSYCIIYMKDYQVEDDIFSLKGWQDHEEQQNYINAYLKPSLPLTAKSPYRNIQTSQQKLPFREHRKCSTKRYIKTIMDRTSLRVQKRMLQKYVVRESVRNTSCLEAKANTLECSQTKVYDLNQPMFRDVMSGAKDKNSISHMEKKDVFSCPKLVKKNRRKFYAKSRYSQEVPKTFQWTEIYANRVSSNFQQKKVDFDTKYRFNFSEAEGRKISEKKKLQGKKSQKFPIFFREVTMDINQKKKSKLSKKQNIIQRVNRNRTHFTSHFLSNSGQFTDDKIFPPKRQARG